jgi:uncharacterized protein (TIGR03435 family)
MIPQFANHLWHSTIFTCVVALLTLMLRRNRAALRHGLWMTASIKFLVPFSLLIGIGREVGWRNVPAIEQPRLEIVEQMSEPFALQASSPVPHSAPKPASRVPAVLFAVWLCGFTAQSLAWWRRWRRVRIALRAASPSSLNLPARAVFGPARLEPGVFGIRKPVLLLPQGITERLTPAQFDAIIAHELCHVRRRDNLAAAIHMVVEALFWFHPLVWWIERRLVEERERACDEEVLQLAFDPKDYAEGIVSVCRLYLEAPLVCMSGVTGANLKQRVQAIMANRSASRLNVGRKLVLATAGIIAVAGPLTVGILTASRIQAQGTTAAPAPKFEAVSIHRCDENAGGRSGPARTTPGRLTAECATLGGPFPGLISEAYGIFADGRRHSPTLSPPIEGGPGWIKSERYTIIASAAGDPGEGMMAGPMLQQVLEDRFHLKLHHETREIPVYALTVGRNGPRLRAGQGQPCAPTPGKPCMSGLRVQNRNLVLNLRGTLAQFAQVLDAGLDRPIADKTGLSGTFDLHLEFGIDQATPTFQAFANPAEPSSGASIFTAIQEQLGLKLEATRGPGDFIVVDRIERPSEN